MLNAKSRLREVAVTLDAEIDSIVSRNVAAVERAGGLKTVKSHLAEQVRRELQAEHDAQVSELTEQLTAVKDKLAAAQGKIGSLSAQLKRRASLTSDENLKTENGELKQRLKTAQGTISDLEKQRPAAAPPLTLQRIRVGNAGSAKGGSHTEYPEWFYPVAMELLSSGATSNQIRRHLRSFQCALLLEMIDIDNGDTKRRAVPDHASVPEGAKGFAVTVRQLGPATKKRQEHDEVLARRVEAMVQQEDDGVLLELENKYLGKRFIDRDGGGEEYREVESIEWNDDRSVHVAVGSCWHVP